MEDYAYDIFFSYKRHKLTLDWIREVTQRLPFWLTQDVGGREVKLFVDEACIETGDHWPEKLKEAVKLSVAWYVSGRPRTFSLASISTR